MYKNIFQLYLGKAPEQIQEKYIFLVDNKELANSIFLCGLRTIAILDYAEDGNYFTTDSFLEYMRSVAYSGTFRMDYEYVTACSSKKMNQKLEAYFASEALKFHSGWRLFWQKEYLERVEYNDELKELLEDYINRLEGPAAKAADADLSRFHRMNDKGEVIGVFDARIVEYLIETLPMFIMNRMPYLYRGGYYCEDIFGIETRYRIQQLIYPEFVKSGTIARVYELLINQPRLQKQYTDLNNYPWHWINFRNGYFDAVTWQMYGHDPKYYSLNQVPFEFDPDKPAGQDRLITSFLSQALPDPADQETFWQYLGYCMTVDTGFQKFLMIKGPGSTGKSVLVDLIEYIIGAANCVSISLQDLNKRFYATSLFGKLLNACADIPSTAMQNIDVLKKAVGEDSVLYERKGQDPTKFRSYAKLVFSANEMPLNLDDKTNAYYRRLLVLEMNRVVPVEKRDRMLREKLKGDTDYILYYAVKALQRLYANGTFTVSSRGEACVEELYRNSDSVKAFLDDTIVKRKGSRINRSRMYREYEDYCKENDRQAHGKTAFFRLMQDKGYYLKKTAEGIFYLDVDFASSNTEFVPVSPGDEIPFEQMGMSLGQ